MTQYVTGNTIKVLREKKSYTQKHLADLLGVSDKAVSKWENGKGLPDISLLEPIAQNLGVSVAELMSGECVCNQNRAGNILKSKFYVCPVCGNVIHAIGEASISCCGITLPVQEAEIADELHEIQVERIENEYYVTMQHPMTKEEYISFFAYVTCDRISIYKLYPEQMAETRFPISGRGMIYAYCNKHGLYQVRV